MISTTPDRRRPRSISRSAPAAMSGLRSPACDSPVDLSASVSATRGAGSAADRRRLGRRAGRKEAAPRLRRPVRGRAALPGIRRPALWRRPRPVPLRTLAMRPATPTRRPARPALTTSLPEWPARRVPLARRSGPRGRAAPEGAAGQAHADHGLLAVVDCRPGRAGALVGWAKPRRLWKIPGVVWIGHQAASGTAHSSSRSSGHSPLTCKPSAGAVENSRQSSVFLSSTK